MNKLKKGMFWSSHYLCHISTTSLEWNKATTEKSIMLKAESRLLGLPLCFLLAFLSWCCRCWTYQRPPGPLCLSHRGYPWQFDSGKWPSRWCGGWRSPWYRSEDWQRILAAWRGPWKPYSPWLHHLWHRKKMFCFIQRLLWEAAGFAKGRGWGGRRELTVKESYWNGCLKQLWLDSYRTQRTDDFWSLWFWRVGLGQKLCDVYVFVGQSVFMTIL